MRLRATAGLALAALLRNRMRSLLTMLGVVIGVAAVLMMQALGSGATTYVGDAISGLGANVLIAIPGASRAFGGASLGVPLFTTADLDAIRRGARDLAKATPVNSRQLRLVYGGNNRATMVSGAGSEYFQLREWGTSQGRLYTADDERQARQVCVIGATVKNALFLGEPPLGKELRVHNLVCRVIGVLDSKGAATFGQDQDDIVFMPYSTFSRRIMGTERVGVILMAAVSKDRIDDAKAEVQSILRHRRHILPGEEDDFGVRDPREIAALLDKVTTVLSALLLGVAGISLLVGGIGIMNIMLVSVTERTREVGVRLAVGARASDILGQFLVEAVVLSALGGVVGLLLGIAGAFGLARAIHVPFVIPLAAMPIGFGVSVAVGVVFGVFPARKAAHLNPLAALRFE